MYLAEISLENFRLFGVPTTNRANRIKFEPGLNLLVGANDSGKSCVIDAIRLLLGTTTSDFHNLSEEDFHIGADGLRSESLRIEGLLRGFTVSQAAPFAEYIYSDSKGMCLRIWLSATRDPNPTSVKKRKIQVEFRTGEDQDGERLDSRIRDLLSATYLRPLRDAVGELGAKKGSRLSQVLRTYREIQGQGDATWQSTNQSPPETLVDIMRQAEHLLQNNKVIQAAEKEVNEKYLDRFSVGVEPLKGRILPSKHDLLSILERLELQLEGSKAMGSRGLGLHNLLFMATELLALGHGEDGELPIVLIEEPEAHLEPQLQLRLVDYLLERSCEVKSLDGQCLQVILTSHSPNLASHVPLKSVSIMSLGQCFSLAPENTYLDRTDYDFLERFLDVTKANLFFARGVIIVEGDAEALLLPTIASILDRPLSRYGVSIVNVGHIGLFRYARIFQRTDGSVFPVPVACIADRDVPPDIAAADLGRDRKTVSSFSKEQLADVEKQKKAVTGGSVSVFVSPFWTFEFDLAICGLGKDLHKAISLAKTTRKPPFILKSVRKACKEYEEAKQKSLTPEGLAYQVYSPFVKSSPPSKAETAHWLARILKRIDRNKTLRQEIQNSIPQYLKDAIAHATGGNQ